MNRPTHRENDLQKLNERLLHYTIQPKNEKQHS